MKQSAEKRSLQFFNKLKVIMEFEIKKKNLQPKHTVHLHDSPSILIVC